MKQITIMVLIGFMTFNCHSSNVANGCVSIGMTKAKTLKSCGKPDSIAVVNDAEALIWRSGFYDVDVVCLEKSLVTKYSGNTWPELAVKCGNK